MLRCSRSSLRDKTVPLFYHAALRPAGSNELIFIEPRIGYFLLVNDEPHKRGQDIVGRDTPLKVLVLRVVDKVGEHLIILFRHISSGAERHHGAHGRVHQTLRLLL